MVMQMFDKQNIEFCHHDNIVSDNLLSIHRVLAVKPESILRCALVKRQGQHFMIVFPASYYCNAEALSIYFNWEEIEFLSLSEQKQFFKTDFFDDFIPLAQVWGIRCIIDKAILSSSQVYLSAGRSQGYLSIKMADFLAMNVGSEVGHFAEPIPEYPEHDRFHVIEDFTHRRMLSRVQDIFELPAMPPVSEAVIHLRSSPETELADLINVIEKDPSLAAQVLSWAQSPYYGYPGKINSIEDAIVKVLGFDLVMNLALCVAVGKGLTSPPLGPTGLKTCWENAIYAAIICQEIARVCPQCNVEPGLAYMVGLLHNLGYLITGQFFTHQHDILTENLAFNHHLNQARLEQQLIGVETTELAAALLEAWNLPKEVIEGVQFYRDPYRAHEHGYYSLMMAATFDILAELCLVPGQVSPHAVTIKAQLGLEDDHLVQVLEALQKREGDIDYLVSCLLD
jgi:HD-like signal output (HDOD) protein/prolyl-tRNA editing enzyme YbaK/EbsC (Cys-tRNA(Pro) deacylase)